MIRFSKSVAVQFAADGIRSNTILPGPTKTPMQARWDENPEMLEAVTGAVPVGRVGTPEDIAGLAIFLSSRACGFTVGDIITCDGGAVVS